MKKVITVLGVFAIGMVFNTLSAQTVEKKEEVRKEVNVEEENGERVLTIKTTTNGKTTTEVYKGAEADAKLKEMKEDMRKEGTTKEVKVLPDGRKEIRVEKRVIEKSETPKH